MESNHANKTRALLLRRFETVTSETFDDLALDIFRYQFTYNQTYSEFCRLVHKTEHNVNHATQIPFLPISLFKTQDIRTGVWEPEIVFESSTTTGQIPGRHFIRDLQFYHRNAARGFHETVELGISDLVWLAVLPSYQERPSSSLISMVNHFISQGRSGSALIPLDRAPDALKIAANKREPVALISVSFALLDLADSGFDRFSNLIVIETGGMKGRREEITRAALHEKITIGFGVDRVFSEYGMTELLSQAWSSGDGMFRCAPTLKVFIRDLADPLTILGKESRGALNFIDLANIDSCAFVATDDTGILYTDDYFEVLGRLDASELRGCNLMYES